MDQLKKKAIKNAKIILENEIISDHVLVFTDKIESIIHESELEYIEADVIEHHGFVSPGFVDIHIHGAGGADTMDGQLKSLKTISDKLITAGTTAFLATTMTMEQSIIERALDTVRDYMVLQKKGKTSGSEILGVHLEGPFINPQFKGAQDEQYIQKPKLDWLEKHLDVIKLITLAPEMDEDFSFIRQMKNKGVVLSMGHTGCDYETACSAFEEGVTHVTHCFNAMTGLHHRNPGAVGAAFAKPFTTELITDGIHVHSGFFDTFIKIKSPDKVILVTDAMRASFLDEGEYDLGGQKVIVADGASKLVDGTIAGSILKMDQALRNVLSSTGRPLEEIVRMLSLNPAETIGVHHQKGSIQSGKDADLVLLTEDLQISQVFVRGSLEHSGGNE